MPSEAPDRIVCYCNAVPASSVVVAIEAGARTLTDIYDKTGAGTGPCGGSCRGRLRDLLNHHATSAPSATGRPQPHVEEMSDDIDEALVEAVSLFNRRYYWETHEVLERVWMDAQGPTKLFLQGIIQAAAALYHVLNANPKGVIKLAEDSATKLKTFAPRYRHLVIGDLGDRLLAYAEQAREILGRNRAGFEYDALPVLLLENGMDRPLGTS